MAARQARSRLKNKTTGGQETQVKRRKNASSIRAAKAANRLKGRGKAPKGRSLNTTEALNDAAIAAEEARLRRKAGKDKPKPKASPLAAAAARNLKRKKKKNR